MTERAKGHITSECIVTEELRVHVFLDPEQDPTEAKFVDLDPPFPNGDISTIR
jgi:hypothetical protein